MKKGSVPLPKIKILKSAIVKSNLEDMDNFHRRERIYQSPVGKSNLVYEIIPPELSFNKWNQNVFQGEQYSCQTAFREFQIVRPIETWNIKELELINEDIQEEEVDIKQFVLMAFNELIRGIEEAWQPDLCHVFLHSSGHDSRLISVAIRKLYEKNGDDWLGKMLFFELSWETEKFKKIMEIEGWDKSQYVIYNEGAIPGEVHEKSFEFTNAWKRLNGGTIGYPINTNYDCIEWLQEQGIIPEDDTQIQCITGHAGTELARFMIYPNKSVRQFFERMYYFALTNFPLKSGNRLHPYYYLPFIRILKKYGKPHVNERSLSDVILRYVAPELEIVERVTLEELTAKGYLEISERILKKVIKDFFNSWFARTYNPQVLPTKRLDYSEWWGFWNLASFCGYLKDAGVKINASCI